MIRLPHVASSSARTALLALAVGLASWAGTAAGQDTKSTTGAVAYKIEPADRATVASREKDGKPALYVTLSFQIMRTDTGRPTAEIAKDEIVVKEDGKVVTELEIHQPASLDALTAMLVIDCSGSMKKGERMREAKAAATTFLGLLRDNADCGLVLFDHEILSKDPPAGDPRRILAHRETLRTRIERAEPRGGTAYFDATAEAVEMLRDVGGRRAVLVLTDGRDLNSRRDLDEVIRVARKAALPVYTLGVGEPGRNEPFTSVLALDRSGSMAAPAERGSRVSKMTALHQAASRFVDLMRPGAVTTLLPFSSTVEVPGPFTADKQQLKEAIHRLRPAGETALFDAASDAIDTLLAARRPGKRAVVLLTDGMDNRSRRRPEEVIARAQQADIPLHLLGLGRPGELNEPIMKRMAAETGGSYHHARDEASLIQIFENLSIELHDEGIDEASLRKLADDTGGKYFPARKVSDLELIYRQLAEELQTTYTVTFPSRRPTHDGTARGIDIQVVRGGVQVSDVARLDYAVHGVVVPVMDPRVFLLLLAPILVLLALPSLVKGLVSSSK